MSPLVSFFPFLFLLFIFRQNGEAAQYDDYDNYYEYAYEEEIDHCNFYETDQAGLCHHQHFPEQPLQQLFNENVKTCCEDHAYMFYDNCDEEHRKSTQNAQACGDPRHGSAPVLPANTVSCPPHCRGGILEAGEFNVNSDGSMESKKHNRTTVHDYCVSYVCSGSEPRQWSVKADVCLCYDAAVIQEVDEQIQPTELLERCCPDTLQVNVGKNVVGCPRSLGTIREEPGSALRQCAGDWMELELAEVELDLPPEPEPEPDFTGGAGNATSVEEEEEEDVEDEKPARQPRVSFQAWQRGLFVNDTLERLHFCTGVSYGFIKSELREGFRPAFMYCHDEECRGTKPCISTCCAPNEVSTPNSTCEPMPADLRQTFLRHDLLRGLNLSSGLDHFERASPKRRRCARGYQRNPPLAPSERCGDAFRLWFSVEEDEVVLETDKYGVQREDFCLNLRHDGEIEAEVCHEDPPSYKFSFYPYVLLVSCIFLLLTFVVYTSYPKLLNFYTRVMRHFTANLFLAFLLLGINQIYLVLEFSVTLCQVIAFLQQFLFLAAFNFMTIMSVEVSLLMSGRGGSTGRYNKEVMVGYGIPSGITLLTFLVEVVAPRCFVLRPKFGQEQCFFGEKHTKFFWFFLPISVMLIINLVMFVKTVLGFLRLGKQKKRLHLREAKKRSDRMDKFLLYLKLFIGMGLIWMFEILAGVTRLPETVWYVTDIFNMSQGIYVFLIFVCKRNVLAVITGGQGGQGTKSKAITKAMRQFSQKGGAKATGGAKAVSTSSTSGGGGGGGGGDRNNRRGGSVVSTSRASTQATQLEMSIYKEHEQSDIISE